MIWEDIGLGPSILRVSEGSIRTTQGEGEGTASKRKGKQKLK